MCVCVLSQIKDRKHIEHNYFHSVAKVMPWGGTAWCWGVENFSVGICDGAPSTARSSIYFIFLLFRSGYVTKIMKLIQKWKKIEVKNWTVPFRHFSVAPYITICPSTETYFGLYLRGAMSEVTGIYLFRLLLNIIFFCPEILFYLNKQFIL